MRKELLNQIDRLLQGSQRFLVSSHERLDGDGVGSELAVYHLLTDMGKAPLVVNDGPFPELYRFLSGAAKVIDLSQSPAPEQDFDCAIILDCPTLERTARVQGLLGGGIPSINIDHHPGNVHFATANLVDEDASCTGELIYRLIEAQNYPLTPDMAEALYTAVLTDTGRFAYENTTPDSLTMAAALMEAGANAARISERIYYSYSPSRMKLLAEVLDTLKLEGGGRIACVDITEAILARVGVQVQDTQEFAELPRRVAGVRVGVLFREMAGGEQVKVSLRSDKGFDVRAVARLFGGGGHREAAGCVIAGSLEQVRERVLGAVEARLEPRGEASGG